MGCGESKARKRDPQPGDDKFFDKAGNPKVTQEGAHFMRMANAGTGDNEAHAVARGVYNEWAVFVAKLTEMHRYANAASAQPYGDEDPAKEDGSAYSAPASYNRPVDFWATAAEEPVSHSTVATVGELFMQYLEMDMRHRRWGGDYSWDVEGMEEQGCLEVRASIIVGDDDEEGRRPPAVTFHTKAHYHAFFDNAP